MKRFIVLKFKEIASRITGISVPIFGISWNPPEPERKVIRDLLIYLEDRRAITYLVTRAKENAVKSILMVREELTKALQRIAEHSAAEPHLRCMRGACRDFLDENPPDDSLDPKYRKAIARLQRIFGPEIAALAVEYGIDLEIQLASVVYEYGNLFESQDSQSG